MFLFVFLRNIASHVACEFFILGVGPLKDGKLESEFLFPA